MALTLDYEPLGREVAEESRPQGRSSQSKPLSSPVPGADSIMSAVTETSTELNGPLHQSAALDEVHIGDINRAFGTIRNGDHGPRFGLAGAAYLPLQSN
jgi:hypothetical protein